LEAIDNFMLKPYPQSSPVPNNLLLADATDVPFANDSSASNSWANWLDRDTKSFLISFGVHLLIVLSLSIVPIVVAPETLAVLIQGSPPEPVEPELTLVEEITYSDTPSDLPGANSFQGEGMALSQAAVVADVSEVLSIPVTELVPDSNLDVSLDIKQAVGLVQSTETVRGMTGVGTQGTDGAVDRITYEILQYMEERPTLVVWLFDASGSLTRRRQEIRDRFDRIYQELGIVRAMREKKKITKDEREAEPLLTSIYSFGQKVNLLTKNPTADLNEITEAIDRIENDISGLEFVFSAVYSAAEKYKGYRVARSGEGPARNVLFVVVTDERGNDSNVGLEKTIGLCRKHSMPVYVMGVPAPFGREKGYIKYVDPDPKFDQTPSWSEVDLGPETYYPERIQLGYEDNYYEEPVVDSGFGPYALSRLCYETGGIYFTVHPNRKLNQFVGKGEIEAFASHLAYFFDPDIMQRYRPDYVPESEYLSLLKSSPMRQALVQASQFSRVGSLDRPRQVFLRTDEAAFVNALTEAQKEPARLENKLIQLCEILFEGSKHRDKELSPRWLASFDLSFGTALAEKVRNQGYNQMLAAAKRGLAFKNPKNNTWTIKPSGEISTNSKLEKEGALAIELLNRVKEEHPGTPWAFMANQELNRPIGWSWEESFTDTQPPPRPPQGNNGTPPPPQNDRARMLERPPTRPVPKL
jgi:hypothetical protein